MCISDVLKEDRRTPGRQKTCLCSVLITRVCVCDQVDVGRKTDWDLGVARQSMNRKGKINVTPSNGYWFLSLRDK